MPAPGLQLPDVTSEQPSFIGDQHTIIVVDEVVIEGHEGNPNELRVVCWAVKAPGAGSATRGGGDRPWRRERKAPKLPKRLYVIEHPADCTFPVCAVEYFIDGCGAHEAVEGLAETPAGSLRVAVRGVQRRPGGWSRMTIQMQ